MIVIVAIVVRLIALLSAFAAVLDSSINIYNYRCGGHFGGHQLLAPCQPDKNKKNKKSACKNNQSMILYMCRVSTPGTAQAVPSLNRDVG